MIWDFDSSSHVIRVGDLIFNTYAILFLGGFFWGTVCLGPIFHKEKRSVLNVLAYFLSSLTGGILGARLTHCFFYNPSFYFSHPKAIIGSAGMASHGGLIGAAAGLMLYRCFVNNQSVLYVCDRAAIAGAFAGVCIRLGNFFNSEILGVPTSLPWGIVFKAHDSVPRHPVVLYEAFFNLVVFAILIAMYRRSKSKDLEGSLLGVLLMAIFGFRFVVDFLKEPQAATDALTILSMGQMLSIPFVAFGVLLWSGVLIRKFPRLNAEGRIGIGRMLS